MGKIAQVEPNLATMPFVCPNPKEREGPVKFEWTAVGRDGQTHDFFQVFKPGGSEDLPGPTAGRVIMALSSMPPDRVGEAPRIKTHLTELTRACQLQKGGATHNRIRRALSRIQCTTIRTNAFWDYGSQRYLGERSVSIFSSHHYNAGPHKTEVDIRWTSAVRDLMNTRTTLINLDHLFSLNSCVARKLYRVSSLGIYQEGRLVEDLKLLCHGYLGITQNREYASELKRSLKGPIEELRETELLDVTIEEAPEMKSGHCVIARPMERMLDTCGGMEDL